MAERIEDYALLGDCHTAALVGCGGSVDWLCLPRFDSGACFASLLGTPSHGRWDIRPVGPVQARRRRYLDGTLVLETEHETAEGSVAVIDFMPIRDVEPNLVRIVEGRRGKVPLRMELVIRFDYGCIVPWVQRTDGGISAVAGPDCAGPADASRPSRREPDYGGRLHRFGGRARALHPHLAPFTRAGAPAVDPETALTETTAWWREWTGRCTYDGPWREAVLRSLITLKALTYAPTGGIVAAADHVAAGATRRRAQLGLPLLLAARRHVHPLRAAQRRLRGGGWGLARLAAAGGGRHPRRPADHVRPGGRAPADGMGGGLAARLRGREAGSCGQRRLQPVPARRLRRDHGRHVPGAIRWA